MPINSLEDIFNDPEGLELLPDQPPASTQSTEEEIAIQRFEEICEFHDRTGFPPGRGPSGREVDIFEAKLAARLQSFRSNPILRERLADRDRHNLLPSPVTPLETPITSLDDVINDDDGDLLTDPTDIFESGLSRPASAPPSRPDKIAERGPCHDFRRYKPLFDQCDEDLKSGRRQSLPFTREKQIEPGEFFELRGVLAYVAEVGKNHDRNGRSDARMRVIFDNGTETRSLLRRSMAKELYRDKNGRRISSPRANPLFPAPPPVRAPIGCVYVARSLSTLPQIQKHATLLHKIGVTTGTAESRIAGAENDPTFLLAKAELVKRFDIYDTLPNKVEELLHAFLAPVRLDIEVIDKSGKKYRPREWFLMPVHIVSQAMDFLRSGTLRNYRYDVDTATIVHK